MGVMAPINAYFEPVIASKYNDPLKKINPKEKNLQAITTNRLLQFLYNTAEAINRAKA